MKNTIDTILSADGQSLQQKISTTLNSNNHFYIHLDNVINYQLDWINNK